MSTFRQADKPYLVQVLTNAARQAMLVKSRACEEGEENVVGVEVGLGLVKAATASG